MVLDIVKYVVLYRPYREPSNTPRRYCLFTDVREAMSFAGSHGRYCSSMDTCKVDVRLTEDILNQLINA